MVKKKLTFLFNINMDCPTRISKNESLVFCPCGKLMVPGRRFCHGHNRLEAVWSFEHKRNHQLACEEANRRPERRELSRELMREIPRRKPGEFHHSDATKKLIGKKGKGRPAWNKNLTKETDERVEKYSSKQIGRKRSRTTKLKLKKKWEDEMVREARFNHPNSINSRFKKGEHPWNFEKKLPEYSEIYKLAACKRIITLKEKKGFTNTWPERKIKEIFLGLQVEFKQNHPINKIKHRYPADFYLPVYNAVIEADGNYTHKYPNGTENDRIRTKEMEEIGIKVLRIWESELKENIEAVKLKIRNFLTKLSNKGD